MCAATEEKEKKEVASEEEASDADSVTRKFGLEAGLWKVSIWSVFSSSSSSSRRSWIDVLLMEFSLGRTTPGIQ
jgi:hypothetical protein